MSKDRVLQTKTYPSMIECQGLGTNMGQQVHFISDAKVCLPVNLLPLVKEP